MVRVFWGCIAVLIALTAGVFLLPSGGDRPSDRASAQRVNATARDVPTATGSDAPLAANLPESRAPNAIVPEEQPEGVENPAPTPDVTFAYEQGNSAAPVAPVINPPTDMPNPETGGIPRSDDTGKSGGPGEPVGSPVLDEGSRADATTAEPTPTPLIDPADAAEERSDTLEPAQNGVSESDSAARSESADGDSEGETPAIEANDDGASGDDLEPKPSASGSSQPVAATPVEAPLVGEPSRIETPVGRPERAEEPARAEPVVATPTGLLLDGQWTVEGEGTADKPYQIEWDMLVALQRDYMPRLGKTEIPAWMDALNGKTVTIRGYALLPMGVSSLSELLVMLNQWDSCCIGVPPTPYDAIEVRLAKPLSTSAQSMFSHTGALSFGDITGTLKIDPYIVQGYLLGLYLMEEASANLLGPAGTP